jgi:glycosyltransferase 2 family protein
VPAGLIPRLVVFLALAMAVTAGLVLYAEGDELLDALQDFTWWVIVPVILLVLANYALRFLRWQYYLRALDADEGLSLAWSALIFLSGLAMVVTPAKVGEWIKSYFLREFNGTPISRSAPLVFIERLTDAWSVALLALLGLVLFSPSYWPLFGTFIVLQVVFWVAIRYRPLANWILGFLHRVPLVARAGTHLDVLYDATYTLLAPGRLAVALALGFIGWSCEAGALYLVIYGLTDMGSMEVLVKSAFIMSTASLAGALFIVPGGLGISETGITALGRELLDLTRSTAAATTLLIRFFTLWLGVAVGLIALFVVARHLDRRAATAASEPGEFSLPADRARQPVEPTSLPRS